MKEEFEFTAAVEKFIATGLRDVKIDPPPKGSSFINLWNRAVPYIDVDNHVLKYQLDYNWRKDRG